MLFIICMPNGENITVQLKIEKARVPFLVMNTIFDINFENINNFLTVLSPGDLDQFETIFDNNHQSYTR